MLGRNVRYQRLKRGWTQEELAEKSGVPVAVIDRLETTSEFPDVDTLDALGDAMDYNSINFGTYWGDTKFKHNEPYHAEGLTEEQKLFITEDVENYIGRFLLASEIVGSQCVNPHCNCKVFTGSIKEDLKQVKLFLGISINNEFNDFSKLIESKGFIVYGNSFGSLKFHGISGFADDIPYIVINTKYSNDILFDAIWHELLRFVFRWPSRMAKEEIDRYIYRMKQDAFAAPRNLSSMGLTYYRLQPLMSHEVNIPTVGMPSTFQHIMNKISANNLIGPSKIRELVGN